MRLSLAIAAAAVLLSAPAAAQDPHQPPPQDVIVGGWGPGVVNAEVRQVAAFALKQLHLRRAKLKAIENVETQLVAGLNFRMDLVLRNGRRWHVQVYRNLRNEMALTSAGEVPRGADADDARPQGY